MKKIFTFLLILIVFQTFAQDTLTVMQYNLLNYGNMTDYCTVSNNNPDSKTAWLKTIIDFYLPDIFTVNELGTDPVYHQNILNQVMNTTGRTWFQKAAATNYANSDIVNMLYYDSRKVGLALQDVVFTTIRDINVYKLFYRYDDLAQTVDTVFFYCIVAHLKAGDSGADKTQRSEMVNEVMQYIEEKQITAPCLFMGDFNLQNSSEQAWSYLTDYSSSTYNFYDPVNMAGSWHANEAFATVHTQSTHVTSNGCAAAGGFDDRFDFILINDALQNNEQQVEYVPGSFTIKGQDGLRFNGSLIDPPNNSAPPSIINALYNMSDHLPVMVRLKVTPPEEPLLCAELFFSEYIEGSGNNKALEIFNPTENTVDLTSYRIARYANGSTNPDVVNLGGTIETHGTYVVVLDKRNPNGTGLEIPVDPELQALADTFLCPDYAVNMTMYFNGDDAMALQKADGELVDLIGKIGQDPGLGWSDDSLCTSGSFTTNCGAIAWTTNHTLVRKMNSQQGLNYNPGYFDVTALWDTLPMNSFDSLRFHRSLCNAELPANWTFTETMNSHILIIPENVVPTLNENPLQPGDYMGVFYLDGTNEICAGFSDYSGTGSHSVVAFGDDETTPEKDGFYDGENIIWKIFSFSEYGEFYAEANFSQAQPANNGKFELFGISVLVSLGAFDLQVLNANLPAGWSGISIPVNPRWKDLEHFFANSANEVIYLSDGENVYYPAGNLYEITEIAGGKSFLIKNTQSYTLEMAGLPLSNKTVTLQAGWNLLSVLSLCPVETSDIQTALATNLEVIKDIAGINVCWPANAINTLTQLLPGKAYFIKVNENCSFTFPNCE